jgi:hypothetical protein
VGDELDFLVNFHLSQHSDIWMGWSKLYAGAFLRSAPSGPTNISPELFWAQYSFKW